MKINDFLNEEKVRLDPKCWTGKKIGNPKTKVKGGVRVNNCVPAESVAEAATPASVSKVLRLAQRHKPEWFDNYGIGEVEDAVVDMAEMGQFRGMSAVDALTLVGQELESLYGQQGMAEGEQRVDSLVTDALKIMRGSEASDAVAALKTVLGDREYNSRRGHYNFYVRQLMDMSGQQGMAEDYNPEYDDEAGMADNNLETLQRAVEGIDDLIQSGDNLPEWCQEKIAVAKSMLVAVWDYMYSEEASDEVDPEIDAMFEAMDQLAEELAAKHGVDVDTVWEDFESMDDNMLYETAAWRRKEGKSKSGGLNAKGVASYRRENPGSKLQTAVTTKPSKLKPGSKAAKRRKSFCARMGGVKGPMKKPNGKPTRKALALRKWNC
jgi:hypothetical protein